MKELRIYMVNLDELEEHNDEICEVLGFEEGYELDINQQTDDNVFIEVAESLGGVMSLGYFIQAINDQELDNLTNSFVRAYIIDTDNENVEPIEIADIETQIYEKLGV